MLKKEISSEKNWKEAVWENALRCLNATHRVTLFSSVYSLLTQFSWNLQWDTSWRNEAYGDKGNILRWKLERSFLRNFLVMCEFISQSYTYVSWSSALTLSLRNLRKTTLDHIEAHADKGNNISSKRERSFLSNFFVICEFISQSYNLVLKKQFANTLFMESAKWDLGAHWGPGWKGDILRELLERSFLRDCFLMCDFITQSSTLPFLEQFANTFVVHSAKW